jgi:hypothetical protein
LSDGGQNFRKKRRRESALQPADFMLLFFNNLGFEVTVAHATAVVLPDA